MNKVSGVILFKNEKDYIFQAMENIYPHVSELIMINDQSTDGSDDLVKGVFRDKDEKVRLITLPQALSNIWGFGDKKNFGLAFVENEWVLNLDADELIEDQFYKELPEMINNKESIEVYGLPRKNYIEGKLTEDYPDYQLRLFRSYCRFVYSVHEELIGYHGKTGKKPLAGDGYHIIHKKSAKRQLRQNKYYNQLKRTHKQFLRDEE